MVDLLQDLGDLFVGGWGRRMKHRSRGGRGPSEDTVGHERMEMKKHRIGLALAPEDAAAGDQVASSVAVGAVLTGVVDRVEAFGVFVRLGPGQTGLVPNAELGTARGADHRKAIPVGTEIKGLVLAIEEGGRRIRLSHAQALAQEEQAETQAYLRDATTKGDGFGLSSGERFRQARRI